METKSHKAREWKVKIRKGRFWEGAVKWMKSAGVARVAKCKWWKGKRGPRKRCDYLLSRCKLLVALFVSFPLHFSFFRSAYRRSLLFSVLGITKLPVFRRLRSLSVFWATLQNSVIEINYYRCWTTESFIQMKKQTFMTELPTRQEGNLSISTFRDWYLNR